MTHTSPPPQQYSVSVWEGVALIGGAILLAVVGGAGLGIKALNNAFDANRAEAIAHSMVRYTIPSGSKGLFGANLGGAKVAVVASNQSINISNLEGEISLANIELFVAQIPVDEQSPSSEDSGIPDDWSSDFFASGFSFSYQAMDAFQIKSTHTEKHLFCKTLIPVAVKEGTLTVLGEPPLPAVRYEAKLSLTDTNHVAIISAVGAEAKTRAIEVFQSLSCKP